MSDTWSKSVQVDKVERFRQDVERLRYTPDALNDSLSATDSYTHDRRKVKAGQIPSPEKAIPDSIRERGLGEYIPVHALTHHRF